MLKLSEREMIDYLSEEIPIFVKASSGYKFIYFYSEYYEKYYYFDLESRNFDYERDVYDIMGNEEDYYLLQNEREIFEACLGISKYYDVTMNNEFNIKGLQELLFEHIDTY